MCTTLRESRHLSSKQFIRYKSGPGATGSVKHLLLSTADNVDRVEIVNLVLR